MTGGTYLGYMIHYPMLVLLLFRAPALWQGGRRQALRVLIPVGIAAVLILAAVYLPYLRASGQQTRTPKEIQIFGASLASYATPTAHNVYGTFAERVPAAGKLALRRVPPHAPRAARGVARLAAAAQPAAPAAHPAAAARPVGADRDRRPLLVLSELRVWELSGVGHAPQVEA